jgi:hypothetical protein
MLLLIIPTSSLVYFGSDIQDLILQAFLEKLSLVFYPDILALATMLIEVNMNALLNLIAAWFYENCWCMILCESYVMMGEN